MTIQTRVVSLLLPLALGVFSQSSQANALTVISPTATGNIDSYFPLEKAFDAQPTWDDQNATLVSTGTGSDAPSYAGRFGYIDFGPDFRHWRIIQTWTQYRSWSGGDHHGFEQIWWDNDKDSYFDGIAENRIKFNSTQGLAHQSNEHWQSDTSLDANQAIIPKGRYLILKSKANITSRAKEFAMVGWFDDYAPPAPDLDVQTPTLTLTPPTTFDYQQLKLVDEVTFNSQSTEHAFKESALGVSKVESLLGQSCRTLPNTGDEGKYFAYQLGKNANLAADKAYVLVIDYPEDIARSTVISNHGAEINRGFHTGNTVGDALYAPYERPTAESLHYGLSQQVRSWEQLFHLHQRFPSIGEKTKTTGARTQQPKDGFWVAVSQFGEKNGPLNQGAAVCRIALYEAPSLEQYTQPLSLPPGDLPQRHLFFREEMADGVVTANDAAQRAVDDPVDWFENKARLMKFLGMNTYSQDLLEFGHNQGWDVGPFSEENEDWYVVSQYPHRWEKILNRLMQKDYQFNLMPYYEYAGSDGKQGLGTEKVSQPLTRDDGKYTRASWSEKANIDVSDPRAVADAFRLLDATLVSQFKGQRPVPKDIGTSRGVGDEWREGWGYIDLGADFQDWKIKQGWSRSRKYHGGPATPYTQVAWYNTNPSTLKSNELVLDQLEPTINFITQTQSNKSYAWSQDFNLSNVQAITPKSRYLVFKSAIGFTDIYEALLMGSHKDTPNQLQQMQVTGGKIDSNHDMSLLFDNRTEFNQAQPMDVAGIWMRTRVSALPQGFGPATLVRFAASLGRTDVITKDMMLASKPLLDSYYAWWQLKRRAFLNQLRDYVRQNVNPKAVVLFTPDSSECGATHPTENARVATDQVSDWNNVASATPVLPYEQAMSSKLHEQALLLPYSTWGGWEYHHSAPRADVQNNSDSEGVMMTYSFNNLFSVSDAQSLAKFNTPSGTAAIRHFCLNEDAMKGNDGNPLLGYFVTDMELAGPYITLPEARALANGNPYYFGYLSSNSFNRGFAGYVRQFNANYLALPALPSVKRDDLTEELNLAVRTITTTEHGTFMAIINTGLAEIKGGKVDLPMGDSAVSAVTFDTMKVVDKQLILDLHPGQLVTVRLSNGV